MRTSIVLPACATVALLACAPEHGPTEPEAGTVVPAASTDAAVVDSWRERVHHLSEQPALRRRRVGHSRPRHGGAVHTVATDTARAQSLPHLEREKCRRRAGAACSGSARSRASWFILMCSAGKTATSAAAHEKSHDSRSCVGL